MATRAVDYSDLAAVEAEAARLYGHADRGDPEGDHVDEDALYFGVLEAIAAGTVADPAALAAAALRASNPDATRWYA
jgi:hypothetical protein